MELHEKPTVIFAGKNTDVVVDMPTEDVCRFMNLPTSLFEMVGEEEPTVSVHVGNVIIEVGRCQIALVEEGVLLRKVR